MICSGDENGLSKWGSEGYRVDWRCGVAEVKGVAELLGSTELGGVAELSGDPELGGVAELSGDPELRWRSGVRRCGGAESQYTA